MPTSNPFAPIIDVGGGASVGPASGSGSLSFGLGNGVGDHHAAALYTLGGLVLLYLLWRGRFRFSTQVG